MVKIVDKDSRSARWTKVASAKPHRKPGRRAEVAEFAMFDAGPWQKEKPNSSVSRRLKSGAATLLVGYRAGTMRNLPRLLMR
jgi:hypothetical protein